MKSLTKVTFYEHYNGDNEQREVSGPSQPSLGLLQCRYTKCGDQVALGWGGFSLVRKFLSPVIFIPSVLHTNATYRRYYTTLTIVSIIK